MKMLREILLGMFDQLHSRQITESFYSHNSTIMFQSYSVHHAYYFEAIIQRLRDRDVTIFFHILTIHTLRLVKEMRFETLSRNDLEFPQTKFLNIQIIQGSPSTCLYAWMYMPDFPAISAGHASFSMVQHSRSEILNTGRSEKRCTTFIR